VAVLGKNNKVLSALCYFSLFFAPFLLPLVVYFIADEQEVKGHAFVSLLSHLLPLIVVPFFALGFGMDQAALPLFLVLIVIGAILVIGTTVWNIVRGIQLLKES
jgi:uncharacterized membrane protein